MRIGKDRELKVPRPQVRPIAEDETLGGIGSDKQNNETRKEKRKEARMAKKQHRHQSWLKKQITGKLNRNLKNSGEDDLTEGEIGVMESDGERDGRLSEAKTRMPFEVNLEPKMERTKRKGETAKRKKTKFEEYLEIEDNNRGAFAAEEDLEMERRLAKKLKVKKGLLTGEDDGMDSLFAGVPSILDCFEQEYNQEYVDGLSDTKSVEEKKNKKRRRKRKVLDGEVEDPNKNLGEEKELVASGDGSESSPALEMNHVEACEVQTKVKYVAPHLRFRSNKEPEEHSQIRRRVRGLLNRLSESNVESVAGEVSTIYHSVSRSVAFQIISEEVLASCSAGPRGTQQYAAVFAAFVAGMSCIAGVDFGAKLLASLAKAFEDEYLKEDNLSLRNLTLLLSFLCIFGVCSSDLIYDFLNKLRERLTEVDVSTILTVLQCCGMKLRGDDPAAMKNFILGIQGRVNELKSASSGELKADANSKRMEFMLETISDIKNNKRRSKDDPPQYMRITKWLQKLRIEDITIQGISWSKLLDPEKKGQWWSAGDVASAPDNVKEVASRIDREVSEAQKMLELAAAQGMNTDTRKAIFCVIMSGEDYLDAFQKLLRLDLRGKQDREVMRVLVECCLQEKVFNKYYPLLASKLCSYDKNHKFTLQYCLWDHFKELESMPLRRSYHLAKFVAEMLENFTLSLAILKIVDLGDASELTPRRIMHFRMLFDAVFGYPDSKVWNIFTRVAVTPKLETLRNGLEFFIVEYVVKADRKAAEKFKVAKKALNNVEGNLM